MFDQLFNLFKNDKLDNLSNTLMYVKQIVSDFEDHFAEDKTSKDAAIDTVIQILQAHKGK